MPTQQKIEEVKRLTEIFKEKPNLFILNYSKVTVKDITLLRQKIRSAGSTYFVAKNTLLKRAFDELGMKELGAFLEGPTAIVISPKNPEEAAKILLEYADQNPEFKFKGGFIQNRVEKPENLKALATLPPRQEMIGKLLYLINSPIQRLVNVLSNPVVGLIRTLNAIASNK